MNEHSQEGAALLPLVAVAASLLFFAGITLAGLNLTGGTFEYPLDDPYIHLALAEQIAGGTYGINAGEVASPGSSPLFPLLLTPFAGLPLQRFLPAFWNVVGLVAASWIWGRLLFEAGYGREGWRWLGLVAAALLPSVLQMPQVAYLGMEHTLHTAAALAVVLGLYRHLSGSTRSGVGLIVVGALLSSAFRFEGMALGLLAGGTLFFTGRRGAGVAAAVAAVLPVLVFAAVLTSLGLEPMPSSVQVKLAEAQVAADNALLERFLSIALKVTKPAGLLMFGIMMALVLLLRLVPPFRNDRLSGLALAVAAALCAHLVVGRIGWLNRYEHYALIIGAAALVSLLPRLARAAGAEAKTGPGALGVVLLSGLLLAGLWVYSPRKIGALPIGSRAILAQQGEMARFAQDYLKTPVAVNDIGRVAWTNPQKVLDLWGLASAEARLIRANNPDPGWAGELTKAHGIPVAMVYDHWIDEGIGKDWVRVGQLDLTVRVWFLGGRSVAFYATEEDHVDTLRDALEGFLPSLSPHAAFVWDEGMAP